MRYEIKMRIKNSMRYHVKGCEELVLHVTSNPSW
jgi:hypothetical protein